MMITGDKKLDNIMEIAEAVFACPEAGKYTKSVEEAKYPEDAEDNPVLPGAWLHERVGPHHLH